MISVLLQDGRVEPEAFTARLQVELKSSPQPYLVPFLKKSLPLLRQSMLMSKMHIDGVRPPPAEVLRQAGMVQQATSQAPKTQTVVRQVKVTVFKLYLILSFFLSYIITVVR